MSKTALLLLLVGALADGLTPICDRASGRRVCDPSRLLSVAARDSLEARLVEIETFPGPRECKGTWRYQMAVVVVESLQEHGHAGDIRGFSESVFKELGVGQGGCDTGVVFALARGDRLNHLTTGKSARHALTDAHAADILSGLRPLLRAGDLDGTNNPPASCLPPHVLTRSEGGVPSCGVVLDVCLCVCPVSL